MTKIIARSQLVIPTNRQRSGGVTPDAIAEKKESILKIGLLNALTVEALPDGRFVLRAGETRLRALDDIAADGGTFRYGDASIPAGSVPVVSMSDLDPVARFEVELEENVRRRPLTWREETAAYARLAELKAAAGLGPRDVVRETQATIAKIAPQEVRNLAEAHQNILLGQHLADPDVAKAKTRTDAIKVLARKLQKDADSRAAVIAPVGLIHGEALAELAKFPDAQFDAIVSDPPYGIGISQLSYQHSSEQQYDDSYATWAPLMQGLFAQLKRVLKPNASGFLFCDFTRFEELRAVAESAEFEVYPRPFIWDRSPDGRLTTPEKWPRRCYECILYFRRGDRPLREFRGDVLRYPADRDQNNYHGAKKPVELYVDLLQRIVGPGDNVLDAFAGSGPLVRAAKRLSLNAWCIEGDDAYFQLMLRLSQGDAQ